MKIIQIHELSKKFGDNEVIKSVSLEFEAGKIYGLVGRNGSGKSVFLKCIAGLIIPTSGYIEVFGKRIGRDADFAPNTGIAIEQPGVLIKKSAAETLRTLASLTQKPQKKEITRLIELVGLDPSEKKPVGMYSMGMKQRLSIAMAMLGDPQLLLLDEPMSNLDHSAADDMRKLFARCALEGKTILIATHVRDDIEELCETVYEFSDGNISIKAHDAMG